MITKFNLSSLLLRRTNIVGVIEAENMLFKIKRLQLALSLVPLYEGQLLFEEMMDHIKARGFEVYYIRPGFTDQEGRLLQCDGIFYRR